MKTAAKYCLHLLRCGDYDRYMSVLFAPEGKRGGLAALYAFNLEIARIRDAVKEPLAGEVRLRWWREAIEAENEAGQSLVAAALLETVRHYGLSRTALLRMCDARIFDLYHDAMPARADLEGYYGDTSVLVIQLACQILDYSAAPACADACGHGGVAQGLIGLLRLLPATTECDQLYIPQDILAAVGTTREGLREGGADHADARARAVSAMLALAREHYKAFTLAVQPLPASVRPAFLPLALVPAYGRRVESLGPEVFASTAGLSCLYRQWLVLRAAVTGNFRHRL